MSNSQESAGWHPGAQLGSDDHIHWRSSSVFWHTLHLRAGLGAAAALMTTSLAATSFDAHVQPQLPQLHWTPAEQNDPVGPH